VIVIDVGCATYGGARSIPYLIEDYHPEVLVGFDPAVRVARGYRLDNVDVIEHPVAAWTHAGRVRFHVETLGGHVVEEETGGVETPCIDLAHYIHGIDDDRIVVKLDVEGGEYILVPHLVEHDADLKLEEILVEWHCAACGIGGNGRHMDDCPADPVAWELRRERIEGMLRCKTGEWNR
jgi:hypothetical protein